MNLYKHTFGHWAPKDSESGIKGYFLAETDEEVYEKIYGVFGSQYVGRVTDNFDEEEHEEYEDTPEQAKKRTIEARGDLNLSDEYTENMFCDLYYGLTLEGWELVQEHITTFEIDVLQNLGILEGKVEL